MCITLPYWHAWLLKCLHLKSWMVCFFFSLQRYLLFPKIIFPGQTSFHFTSIRPPIQKTLWLYRVSCLFCSFFICVFFFFKYINKLCSRTLSFHESMISFSQLSCPVLNAVLHKALKVLSVQPYITDDETPPSFLVLLHWWALTCTYLSIKVFHAQGFLYAAGEVTQFTRFYLYITYQVSCCSGRNFF